MLAAVLQIIEKPEIKMRKKRGIAWKNFLILMSFMTVVVLALTIFIYKNAVSGMRKEMRNVSMNQISQIDNNFSALIEQVDHLASSLCVDENVRSFWSVKYPEMLDNDFYLELKAALKRSAYNMNNVISSIIIYAPGYDRIMDENMISPVLTSAKNKHQDYNVQWIKYLQPLNGRISQTGKFVRAVNDSYPYVLTLTKQCVYGNSYGAMAIDIDLKKIYSAIMPEGVDNLSVWILDSEGRIIVQKNKNQLYSEKDEFAELAFFEKGKEKKTKIWVEDNQTVIYTQKYNEDTGFYLVTSAVQSDFDTQMKNAYKNAISVGLGCVCLAGLLVMVFVHITNKPWENILSLLDNPSNYEAYLVQNENEAQKIVDYIVSNLQVNNNLKEELEERIELLSITKLQALKAQINPHFLFNTLNAIVMMIDMEIEDSMAAKLTSYLSDILHYSLSNEDLASLRDELEYAEKYVYILEQRYHGRFKTHFDIEPSLLDAKVPKLLLQPLLENAVFHGITAKENTFGGNLQVIAKKETMCIENEEVDGVHIDVIDNGAGMSQEKINKIMKSIEDEHISMEHIGIGNVAKRLALLFPQKSNVNIESKIEEQTKVSLMFPFVKEI